MLGSLSVQQHPRDQGNPRHDHRQVNKLDASSASVQQNHELCAGSRRPHPLASYSGPPNPQSTSDCKPDPVTDQTRKSHMSGKYSRGCIPSSGKPSYPCAMIPPSAFRQSPADRSGSCRQSRWTPSSCTTSRDTTLPKNSVGTPNAFSAVERLCGGIGAGPRLFAGAGRRSRWWSRRESVRESAQPPRVETLGQAVPLQIAAPMPIPAPTASPYPSQVV
jgi:hypothetical protein